MYETDHLNYDFHDSGIDRIAKCRGAVRNPPALKTSVSRNDATARRKAKDRNVIVLFSGCLFAVAIKMTLISGQTLKVFKTFRV